MRDISGSRARTSLLAAGVGVVSDIGVFPLVGPPPANGWRLFAATALVDATLAAQPTLPRPVCPAKGPRIPPHRNEPVRSPGRG